MSQSKIRPETPALFAFSDSPAGRSDGGCTPPAPLIQIRHGELITSSEHCAEYQFSSPCRKSFLPAPVQLPLFPETAHLIRIDPSRNARRFYSLSVERDLFGHTILVRRYGRIGRTGKQRSDPYPDAGLALDGLARIVKAKRRRGYVEQLS